MRYVIAATLIVISMVPPSNNPEQQPRLMTYPDHLIPPSM